MKNIKDALKNSKVPKEKKWLYNFARKVIDLYEQDKPMERFQNTINNYHRQHKEQYFTKKMHENKGKYKKKYKSSTETLEKQREVQKEYRRIYNLYKTGKLSKHSMKVIEENKDE